ncbi:hypothetical protein C1T31_00530 [Hanstruepera neustonica]|uniref:Uncharacterized protein n=1 Tax=Hanstruepera neustonica TaxID=1445657 RepID=A0A2K1E326_9FLAO|nr:hypothetical protein [Hanstruepera neustonica]PNQ74665.1 hypothetical protein C1T31_00530 [Hanstruepera neustonica]
MKWGPFWFLCLLFATCFKVQAHPSWGIVVDDNGCIYFADVMHNGDGTLWRLDPNSLDLEAVFTNFHAHQIYLNKDNEIIAGIAKWRTGEIEGEGHNYLFKYEQNVKQLDTLLFTDDWDEYHGQVFAVSNDLKQVYFAFNKQIHLKTLSGQTSPLLSRKFERISTLTTDSDDNLWITDSKYKNGALFKWSEKEGLIEIANNLMPQNPKNPIFSETNHHLFYGISFDSSGNPLVTENANRTILSINKNDEVKTEYTSELYWSPTGVYYKDDHYYIMETGYNKKHLGPRIVIADKNFKPLRVLEIDFSKNQLKN